MKNILSLECVVDWLGTLNPKKRYKYDDNCNCALAQYFKYVGLPLEKMYSNTWEDFNGAIHPLSIELNDIVAEMPHTFGANKPVSALIGLVEA